MDYTIRILQGYGISERVVTTVIEQTDCFFDLIISSKLAAIQTKTNRKAAFRKVTTLLQNHLDLIDLELFNNPYILLAYGAPERGLKAIVDAMGVTTILGLKGLSYQQVRIGMKRGCRVVYKQIQKAITVFYDVFSKSDKTLLIKNLILYKLFIDQQITYKCASAYICDFINHYWPMLKLTPKLIEAVISELVANGYLQIYHGYLFFPKNIFYQSIISKAKIEKPTLSFSAYLQSDFKDRELLRYRINGLTLEEIGQIMGITRERVRQRQAKVLEKLPKLVEINRYQQLFETYDFNQSDFVSLFHESPQVYQLLNLLYKHGQEDVSNYVLNSSIFSRKEKLDYAIKHKFFITHFGELKRITKVAMIEETLYAHRNEQLDLKTLAYYFREKMKEYPQVDIGIDSLRAIEAVVTRSQYAIHSFGRKFRYFDYLFSAEEISALQRLMQNLEPGSYTMLKLYNENKRLMTQLDVHDEYELHYLYRHKYKLLTKGVKLKRSPEFIVGNIEKKKFIKTQLLTFAGQNIEQCLDYLYEVYGHKRNTMAAYISANFRALVHNGLIMSADVQISDQTLFAIKHHLKRTVYAKSEMKNILRIYDQPFSVPLLDKLGYFIKGNIVFEKQLRNVNNAFYSLISRYELWYRPLNVLGKTKEMTSFLIKMEKDQKLFMIDDNIYASIYFLAKYQISLPLIRDFIQAVNYYLKQKKITYFSLYSLKQRGFYHKLLSCPLKSIFLERLLVGSSYFHPINRKSPLLFVKGSTKSATLAQFFSDKLVLYENGIDLQEFLNEIKKEFQISFQSESAKEHLRRYGAFYSSELKKLYFDKEAYLEEIYAQ